LDRPLFPLVRKKLKEAKKQLRKVIQSADEIRVKHLDERNAAYALANFMTTEKAAKRTHAAERQRAMYLRIQRVLGKGHKGSINKILVPDETREEGWRPLFDQEEILQRLIEPNQEHSGQAEGTPLTTGEVHDILGWDSLTEEAAAILAPGTFDVESLANDDANQAILRKLGEQKTIPELPTTITAEELIEAIKKWKERTSASPSGRHLGHLKAMLAFERKPEIENVDHVILSLTLRSWTALVHRVDHRHIVWVGRFSSFS
jgi:hypothetical protein